MKTYKMIQDAIINKKYEAKMKYERMTRRRHDAIIDEDKSVKWNREEVQRLNNKSLEKRDEYRNSVYQGELRFKEDLAVLIENLDGCLNGKQAKNIVSRAWRENKSEGLMSVLDSAVELAEFVIETIRLMD